MKHFVALIAGVALSATTLGIASADQTFGAGRRGANGMSDPWSRPSETRERYGTHLETEEEENAPLGAGRRGADGMSDPPYRARPFGSNEPFGATEPRDTDRPYTTDPRSPKGPHPFSSGDAPIDYHDQGVPNGH